MENTSITQKKADQNQIQNSQMETLKTIAETAYNDYKDYSKKMDRYKKTTPFFSKEFMNYLKFLSRERDLCLKQYLTAFQALKQINSKPLQVNIKTNSAYLAQNQQNNFEINDPQ